MLEPMPTTLAGFKDHPIYLLARHLKQTEALLPAPPDTPVMGNFRGEPVYPRSAVVSLKTPENWMRKEGRQVKEGAVAMKFIKVRAGTIGKQREIEGLRERLKDVDANSEGLTTQNGELMQGLYARHQTEPYVPEPVIDVSFTAILQCDMFISVCRAKFQRMPLGMLIYMCLRCCLLEVFIYHVSPSTISTTAILLISLKIR
jgi:hypothetical protein